MAWGVLRQGEAGDDAMRRIGQESARMSKLVEDLLLLARLDEGQPMNPAPSSHSCGTPSPTCRPRIRRGPLPSTGSEERMAVVDAAAVRQVVINLLTNAVTYTPPTASVAVRVEQQVGQVVLEVTDSGPGMDDEGVAHALDRFWRADMARTKAGSGLGLSIVRGIALVHGGQVSLTSDPLRGTTVRVLLPVRPPGDAS